MRYGREQPRDPRKGPDLSSTYPKMQDSPLSAGYGMSEQDFRRWYPGPERRMTNSWYGGDLMDSRPANYQNRLADAVAMHNKEPRARNEAGWDSYNATVAAQQANLLASAMQPRPEDQPIAPNPGAAAQTWTSTTGMGVGPARRRDDKWHTNRLRDLLENPEAFQKTPGFKAALDTGRQAIERSFAARGMGNSGNVLAELMKFGTGLASQEYGAQLDRLSRLAQDEQGNPDYWQGTRWGRRA